MRLSSVIAALLIAASANAGPREDAADYLKFLALGNAAAAARPAALDEMSYQDALSTLDALSPGDIAALGLLVELGELEISSSFDNAILYRAGLKSNPDR